MLCMATMQQLFKDGFVEKYGERGLRPPKVKRLSAEDGGFTNLSNDLLERGTGGWIEANSLASLTQSMKFWGIDDEINVTELSKNNRPLRSSPASTSTSDSSFKAELRLIISTRGRRVPQGAIPTVSSKIELYAAGTGSNKKDAKGKCSLNMVLQLYKYQILGPSHYGTRPGPKAREFSVTRGQLSSQYTPDDLAILTKLNSIRPKPADLEIPNRSIAHIEAALRLVSDWVHEDEYYKHRKYSKSGKRTLIGIQRVGPIAMDLTMNNERRAHLVLTSARLPTNHLLKTVCQLTPKMLESCENLHVPFKSIQSQKVSYQEREREQMLANEEWEYVSDDTASEDEAEMDAEEAVLEEKERIQNQRLEARMLKDLEDRRAVEEEKKLREILLANFSKKKKLKEESGEPSFKKGRMEICSADECSLPPSDDDNGENFVKKETDIDVSDNESKNDKTGEIANKIPDSNAQIADSVQTPLESDAKTSFSNVAAPTRIRIKDRQSRRAERAIRRTELKINQAKFLENKTVNSPDFYSAKLDEKSSGFLIYYGIEAPDKMLVRVTLTSSLLKKDKNKTNFKIKADESLLVNPRQEVQEEVLINFDEDFDDDDECFSDDECVNVKNEMTEKTESQDFGDFDESITKQERIIIESEEGLTNKNPAIGALTELRRVKWFAFVGAHVPYLHDTVRLIRGLSMREPAWRSFRPLCPWAISLIARHVLIPTISKTGGSTINLSPSKALIKILEAISSGFKMPINDSLRKEIKHEIGDFSGGNNSDEGEFVWELQDPVEGIGFDALSLLGDGKKEEVIECAKMALDLIRRKNCDILLGVKVEIDVLDGN